MKLGSDRGLAAGYMSRRARMLIIVGAALLGITAVAMVPSNADAARFFNRGLYINSARGGDTTHYILSLGYPTSAAVGSLRLEFCDNPIPSLPCEVPEGLDVSAGTLTTQSGSTTGYTITTQTQNLIVLSRAPSLPGAGVSSYRFDDMVNPDGETQDFYIRMTSHGTTDGTGPFIDFGSVSATTTQEIGLYTQVPPVLIFCVAAQINDTDCEDLEGNYVNFGDMEPNQTYATTSEIHARTNAQYGYTISVTGKTMTSGIKYIPALEVPTESFIGVSQFGMNLAANNTPAVGASPVGPGTNANISPEYDMTDHFVFNDGDTVVTSNGVTRNRTFTASYIINISEEQAAGVYSTTVTYVCMAGF